MLPLLVAMVVAGVIVAVVQLGLARNRRELAAAQASLQPDPPGVPQLDVRLHEVTLPDGTRYWVFVSHSFAALGHPELVLSLVREAGDVNAEITDDALVIFRSLDRAVRGGARFQAWQSGEFGDGRFGRADLNGWALVPAEAPPPVTVPPGALTILLLTGDEAAVARTRGAPSITALLGEHYRHYPTAWWTERHRASTVERHPRGVLGGTARFQPGLWTLLGSHGIQVVEPDPRRPDLDVITTGHPDELVVTVDRTGAAALAPLLRQLHPDQLALFSTAPSPDAAARLVWLPDRPRYGIVGPGGGDTLSGNWIAFGVSDDATLQGASLVEDGFVCLLSSRERAALVAALDGAQALEAGPPERRWRLVAA